jgi:hypothetical protein
VRHEFEYFTNENNPQGNMKFVRFDVFTAVTMKNGVFWDVTSGAKFLRNVSSYKSHTA